MEEAEAASGERDGARKELEALRTSSASALAAKENELAMRDAQVHGMREQLQRQVRLSVAGFPYQACDGVVTLVYHTARPSTNQSATTCELHPLPQTFHTRDDVLEKGSWLRGLRKGSQWAALLTTHACMHVILRHLPMAYDLPWAAMSCSSSRMKTWRGNWRSPLAASSKAPWPLASPSAGRCNCMSSC